MLNAKVALRGLEQWLKFVIHEKLTSFRTHFDHSYGVIRTVCCAGATTDAGARVDDNFSTKAGAVNRTSGTTDHANGIDAVHASIGDHQVIDDGTVTKKSRIAVMRRSTSTHTIVATSAAIHINDHGFCPIEKTVFRHELHQPSRGRLIIFALI